MENPTPRGTNSQIEDQENNDFRSPTVLVPVRTSCWFDWCSGDLTTEKARRCQVLKIISASFLPGLLLLAQNSISLRRSQTVGVPILEAILKGGHFVRKEFALTLNWAANSFWSGLSFLEVYPFALNMNEDEEGRNSDRGTNIMVISEKEAMYKTALYGFEIARFIHLMQIERGTSAMFVGSGKDTSLILRLQDAYDNTNDAIWSLSKWIPVTSQQKFGSRESYEKWIQDFRFEVFTSDKTTEEVVAFYTAENAQFIDWLLTNLRKNKALDNWSKLVPYHFLIISKEAAGIERAVGSALYTRETWNGELLFWYQEAYVMGNAFLENCIFYSPFTENLLKLHYHSAIIWTLALMFIRLVVESELEANLAFMRGSLLTNETVSHSVHSGEMWFDNMTLYINLLQDIHDRLGTEIIQQTEAEIQAVRTNQNVSIVMIVLASTLLIAIIVSLHLFFKQVESFVVQLEMKTVEYIRERRKNEHLMLQILPLGVAKKLVKTSHVEPEFYKSATIFFSDIYHFTELTSDLNPVDLIKVMNAIYQVMDDKIEAHCAYKVETIGDGYMVASGIPERNDNRHTVDVAELSLDLIKTMETFRVPQLKGETLLLRIGFCTGPVSSGVIGVDMPRYCVFGDTVNIASRMKSTSLPMKIQISEDTYKILNEEGCYVFKRRGYVPVKEKGDILSYWFLGRKGDRTIGTTDSSSVLEYTAITNIDLIDDDS